ncbi:hypothetical protein G9A89_007033 [Geosiphon pyriformis]|nr:hypothetical protein G9A89_007033 [Geosiphon pyriformis]
MTVTAGDVLEILVAILFPPAAVLMVAGCGADFCINIGLTILGYIPGHIHAFYILYKKHEAREAYHRRSTLLTSPSMPVPSEPMPPPYNSRDPAHVDNITTSDF